MGLNWINFESFISSLGLSIFLILLMVFPVIIIPKLVKLEKALKPKVLIGLWAGLIVGLMILLPQGEELSQHGYKIDSRAPVLVMISYFMGPISALVLAIVSMAARLILGGEGLWFGIWSILVCTSTGVAARILPTIKTRIGRAIKYYLIGLFATFGWITSFILLPEDLQEIAFNAFVPSMLFIFPILTVFLGLIVDFVFGFLVIQRSDDLDRLSYEKLLNRINTPILSVHISSLCELEKDHVDIKLVNEEAKKLVDSKLLLTNNLHDVFGDRTPEVIGMLSEVIEKGCTNSCIETSLYSRTGNFKPVKIDCIDYSLEEGSGYRVALTILDLSDSVEMDLLNHKIKFVDPLTHLGNRSFLEAKYGSILENKSDPLSVGALIVIHLKDILQLNATIGLKKSDQLILEIANRIKAISSNGIITSRISESSFGIVFIDDELHEFSDYILLELKRSLSQRFFVDELDVQLNLQVGLVRSNEYSFKDMLASAKISISKLESAKSEQVAVHTFDSTTYNDYLDKLKITKELKHSLDNDLLNVFYQPIVDAKTGVIVKAEALVRWHHPVLGNIPPIAFITIAEKIGLIGRIGLSIRQQVVAQMVKWKELGIYLPVSINVSPLELNNATFSVRRFEKDFEDNGLDLSLLTFEITETAMVENDGFSSHWFKSVKKSNFSLAIDDFGVGYSSLSQLDSIDADYLKVDKSFIDDIETSATKVNVLKNVVKIAHAYSMQVIVEGVETEAQWNLLKAINCDYFQGYYFHKPMPAREINDLLTSESVTSDAGGQ